MSSSNKKKREEDCFLAVVPIAGLVSAALIGEPRAHEHVFVDPSTQAVDVGRHLAPRLHDRQN